MANDTSQIAKALKAAGEALTELGRAFETYGLDANGGNLEQPRRKRAIKDKNAPKKNYSSYLHFCDQQRPELQKLHPNFSQPELAKLLGEQWKSLSTSDKEPYQKAADEDKVRYVREMANYTPHDANILTTTAETNGKSKSKSKKSAPAPASADVNSTTHAPSPIIGNTNAATDVASDDKDKKRKKKKKKNHKNKE